MTRRGFLAAAVALPFLGGRRVRDAQYPEPCGYGGAAGGGMSDWRPTPVVQLKARQQIYIYSPVAVYATPPMVDKLLALRDDQGRPMFVECSDSFVIMPDDARTDWLHNYNERMQEPGTWKYKDMAGGEWVGLPNRQGRA